MVDVAAEQARIEREIAEVEAEIARVDAMPVSYTHLTLPTSDLV